LYLNLLIKKKYLYTLLKNGQIKKEIAQIIIQEKIFQEGIKEEIFLQKKIIRKKETITLQIL